MSPVLQTARTRLTRWLHAARLRRARWVPLLETLWDLRSAPGRGRMLTRLRHGQRLHQITEYTERERYPALFDLTQRLRPQAQRILSFGCSTGEEVEAIRRRFPDALIVGAEINPRSRGIAARKFAADARIEIRAECEPGQGFDIIFAMAVLQFKPHWVERNGVQNLAPLYPFDRFEAAIARLTGQLKPGGLLCVVHAHYRVEDTKAASRLVPVSLAPLRDDDLFQPDGARYDPPPPTASMFVARDEGRAAPDLA